MSAKCLPALIRRRHAREMLGISEQNWARSVKCGVIKPHFLLWKVVNSKGVVLFEGDGETAQKLIAEQPGHKAVPIGKAYFVTAELQQLVDRIR